MKKKIASLSLFIVLPLALTSCDMQAASNAIEEGVGNVVPNLYITLAQLGAFLVMVLVFFKFFYKPIKQKLKDRQDYVEKKIEESKLNNQEAQKDREIAAQNIKDSRLQAKQIVDDANKEAKLSAEQIIADANDVANNIREQGERDAQERKKEIEREAHDTIVKSAIMASKEILGREIDEEDNEKVVNDFIDKMNLEDKD